MKPTKKNLKKNGYKLVLERRKADKEVYTKVDKEWFARHKNEYLKCKRVTRIYENDNYLFIFQEV